VTYLHPLVAGSPLSISAALKPIGRRTINTLIPRQREALTDAIRDSGDAMGGDICDSLMQSRRSSRDAYCRPWTPFPRAFPARVAAVLAAQHRQSARHLEHREGVLLPSFFIVLLLPLAPPLDSPSLPLPLSFTLPEGA